MPTKTELLGLVFAWKTTAKSLEEEAAGESLCASCVMHGEARGLDQAAKELMEVVKSIE